MNKVILAGRLAKDPDVRHTQKGDCVASITVAVDRPRKDGQQGADFIPCVVWGNTAKAVGDYKKKGDFVIVEGRMQIRSYEAQDGGKRYVTEVMVSSIEFVGGSKEKKNSPADAFGGGYADEEVPF